MKMATAFAATSILKEEMVEKTNMNEKIRVIYDMEMPMRDNTVLRANMYGQDDDKAYPAILIRFPYLKNAFEYKWSKLDPLPLARAGYRVIIQDCRGTGASDGYPDFDKKTQAPDGYDSVEWIASQSWCDGNVGMYGLSYYGFTQLLTAETQPPHLKAICPWQQTGGYKYSGGFTTGALHLSWLLERASDYLHTINCPIPEEKRKGILEKVNEYQNNFKKYLMYEPQAENPAAFIKELPMLEDYARRIREYDDPACPAREGRPIDFSRINVPCLFLGGWYDDSSKNGPIENWKMLSLTPNGSDFIKRCKLIMGPWNHGELLPEAVGERNFGSNASYPYGGSISDLLIRWFDYHLKGIDNGIMDETPVLLYMMGKNEWRKEIEWPIRKTDFISFYLHSTSHAGVDLDDGKISTDIPKNEKSDTFYYDPDNPVPSRVSGISSECQNQQPIEAREDVLTYTSHVLEEDLEVIGEVTTELFVSSDRPDTDFVCKLTEVYPDGRSLNITDGAVRASYNNTYERKLLKAGEIRKVTIFMGNTGNVFRKGNRIRIDISSSSFPKYDRNPNMAERIGTTSESAVAENTVHHNAQYNSRLILPVCPKVLP